MISTIDSNDSISVPSRCCIRSFKTSSSSSSRPSGCHCIVVCFRNSLLYNVAHCYISLWLAKFIIIWNKIRSVYVFFLVASHHRTTAIGELSSGVRTFQLYLFVNRHFDVLHHFMGPHRIITAEVKCSIRFTYVRNRIVSRTC